MTCGGKWGVLLGTRRERYDYDSPCAVAQTGNIPPDAHSARSLPSPMSDSDPAIKHFQDLVSPAYANADPTTLHIRASALLARLKALNRSANVATRTHKQATADARQDMDQTHLGLQNLLYEKRHLEREIDKCRQFAYALPLHVTALTLTPRTVALSTRTSPFTPSQTSRSSPHPKLGLPMSLTTHIN